MIWQLEQRAPLFCWLSGAPQAGQASTLHTRAEMVCDIDWLPGRFNALPGLFQRLGENAGFPYGGNKVGIPPPARQDVHMQVLLDAGAGGGAQVGTQIEAAR